MEDKEVWKIIPSYSNYEASNFGRIRNKETLYIKKCKADPRGYIKVGLKKDKKDNRERVHTLIMEAFTGIKSNKSLSINHIDGNKSNNYFSNLEFTNPKENTIHALKNNLMPTGSSCYLSKLTEETVRYLHKEYLQGKNVKDISKENNINVSYLNSILKGYKWSKIYYEFHSNEEFLSGSDREKLKK